jgi:hypothetical protein
MGTIAQYLLLVGPSSDALPLDALREYLYARSQRQPSFTTMSRVKGFLASELLTVPNRHFSFSLDPTKNKGKTRRSIAITVPHTMQSRTTLSTSGASLSVTIYSFPLIAVDAIAASQTECCKFETVLTSHAVSSKERSETGHVLMGYGSGRTAVEMN